MNPFVTIPGLVQLLGAFRKYNKMIPEFEKLRAAEDYEGERELIQFGTNRFADDISGKFRINHVIEGAENIPEKGPVLIVANHQSYADVMAIYYAVRKFQIGFIAKSEFTGLKPLATMINYTRSLFINRGDAKEAIRTLNEASNLAKKGFSFVIFPEGTRSKGHEMADFKPGSFKFAQKAKIPVLPITLEGGYNTFEAKGSLQKDVTVHVLIHPLVDYGNMSRKEQNEANVQIEETIREGLKRFE